MVTIDKVAVPILCAVDEQVEQYIEVLRHQLTTCQAALNAVQVTTDTVFTSKVRMVLIAVIDDELHAVERKLNNAATHVECGICGRTLRAEASTTQMGITTCKACKNLRYKSKNAAAARKAITTIKGCGAFDEYQRLGGYVRDYANWREEGEPFTAFLHKCGIWEE